MLDVVLSCVSSAALHGQHNSMGLWSLGVFFSFTDHLEGFTDDCKCYNVHISAKRDMCV